MKNPITWYINLVRSIEQAKREGRVAELREAAQKNAELQKLAMQPRRYETINGCGELGWGAFMLCMALSGYAVDILPKSSWRGWVGMVFLVCGMIAMPICLWVGKRFVVRSRIGYVAFRFDRPRVVGMIVGMSVAVVLSIWLSLHLAHDMVHAAQATQHTAAASGNAAAPVATMGPYRKWSLVTLGPVNALLFLMMNAISIRDHRWKWLLFALIATVPFMIYCLVPGDFNEVMRPTGLFLGLAWCFSGLVTLVWFLQHHRPAVPEAE